MGPGAGCRVQSAECRVQSADRQESNFASLPMSSRQVRVGPSKVLQERPGFGANENTCT